MGLNSFNIRVFLDTPTEPFFRSPCRNAKYDGLGAHLFQKLGVLRKEFITLFGGQLIPRLPYTST